MTSEKDIDVAVPGIDPAWWRGMTQRRFSRRQALGATGASVLAMMLAGEGEAVASTSATLGSASWWKGQKLHHQVNFANWPYYSDVRAG